MHFLIDAPLPPALTPHLASFGYQAEHVLDLGMASADDREIWRHVAATGVTLMSPAPHS